MIVDAKSMALWHKRPARYYKPIAPPTRKDETQTAPDWSRGQREGTGQREGRPSLPLKDVHVADQRYDKPADPQRFERAASNNRKKEIDRYEAYVAESQRVLNRLDRPTIAHLLRAMESSEIDGFPPGNPESSIHARNSVSKPTESATYARLENSRTDQLLDAATGALTSIVELSGHAVMIQKRIDIVIHAGDKIKSEQLAFCHACHRPVERTATDPIRNGYCNACRMAFGRWKDSFSSDDQPTARRFFEEQRPKFEGHLEAACEMCAYLAELKKPAIAS